MGTNYKYKLLTSVGLLGLLLTAGCSSEDAATSSSGSSVSFSVPSAVDVLKVDTSSSSSLSTVDAMDYTDAASDYSKQPQSMHVSHPVGESLSTVGNIMCFIGQLGVAKMWDNDKLPRVYLVGVDDTKCNSDSGQPSQGASNGGGGSSSATSLTMVTVRLSREASGAFPRAEFWFTQNDGPGGQAMELRASIDVISEPTSTLPYGKFNLHFAMIMSGEAKGGGSLLVSGTSAAPIAYTFYEEFTEGGQSSKKGASVEMQADGSSLKGAVQSQSPWDGNSAWVVGTTSTSVKANNKTSANASAGSVSDVDLTGGVCLNKSNFKYRIHGYGLYKETDGSKVNVSTGVSCQYTDSSSVTRNCHIDRNGAWFERDSSGSEHTAANGDTVTRKAWGSDSSLDGQSLTLFVADGRLMKYAVKKYTLTEIRGMEFRLFDNGSEAIIKYQTALDDSVASDGFYKVATLSWGNSGPTKTDVTPTKITINSSEWKWFYSEALGGVSYIGGNTFVTARLEALVAPGNAAFSSGSLALKCLNKCPKSGITNTNLQSYDDGAGAGPYVSNPGSVGGAIDYLVTESNMVLHKGTTSSDPAVALATGAAFDSTGSKYEWGVESGAMVTDTSGLSNLWSIYDTEGTTYYQYRMGPNNWDKLFLVKDPNGSFLTFDEPISFDYTHTTANDRNGDSTYNGKKFLLKYQGEGHFEGFPWDQIDRDGDGTPDMWFPQVSLKDAVQLTANSVNYRIKAMYGDLTLTTTGADCSSISTLSLPTTDVPTAKASNPSNLSTTKPDHGTCQFDNTSETASAGCT